jgi:hypothetical protein
MKVFKIPSAPLPPAYDSDAYTQQPYQPDILPRRTVHAAGAAVPGGRGSVSRRTRM